jgi:hypothetical protein
VTTLNETPGTALVVYCRVFKPGGNNPDLEALESLTSKSFALMSFWAFAEGIVEQMRRAVKDYKCEVHEGRMTEECSQYLAQLQKDWERHRVKLGVEALRKEVVSSTRT